MEEIMEYINLKERKDILTLGIKDQEGKILKDKDGKEICIEFDLGDIELPFKYNKCVNLIEQARKRLKAQFIIIDKKQDNKGNQLLSTNEMAKMNALKQFYREMEEAMDLFLGKNGTKKFLNGKNPYYEMWDDIGEAIKPYLNKMKLTFNDMTERIKKKYNVSESDVLTND